MKVHPALLLMRFCPGAMDMPCCDKFSFCDIIHYMALISAFT